MAKLGIEFDGFEKLIQKLEDVEDASEQAVENALVATHELVTGNLQTAIAPPKVVNSPSSAGLIARGVLDLWTPTGAADFSPYFKSRAIQLALKDDEDVQAE